MKTDVKFSVILPVYNVELYLKDCLASLLNQSYSNFEIIAVNDGSSDKSLDILESFANLDSRIKIISQNNQGLSSARNTGLKHAKGEYIQFVDSDDVISNNLLGSCVSTFKKYNTNMLIFNHAEFEVDFTFHIDKIKKWENGKVNSSFFFESIQHISTSKWIPVWLYSFKKSFLDGYNLKFQKGIIHEDNLFTPLALYYAGEIAIVSEKLYYYRKREGSITNNKDNIKKSLSDQLFIAEELFKISQETKSKHLLVISIQRYQILLNNIKKHDLYKYSRIFNKSIKTRKIVGSVFYNSIQNQKITNKAIFIRWLNLFYKYKIKTFFRYFY